MFQWSHFIDMIVLYGTIENGALDRKSNFLIFGFFQWWRMDE